MCFAIHVSIPLPVIALISVLLIAMMTASLL